MELARCNGTVLVRDGNRLALVDIGGGWLGTATFVAALLAAIATAAGVALLGGGAVASGAVVLGLGAVAAAGAVRLRQARRDRLAAPRPAPWLVFDLDARVVLDGGGAVVGSLDGLRLERVFQAGSSSKALAAFCPREVVLARGTPFGDEVDDLEAALRHGGVGS